MWNVAVTGHRPEKIPDAGWVRHELENFFRSNNINVLYVGCAHGVDMWAARVARRNNIPYIAVRPWRTHGVPEFWQEEYTKMISGAVEVIVVNEEAETYPGPRVYQQRNERMVDLSDYVVSVWDGSRSGTKNCVEYALTQNKRIYNLNPETQKISWLSSEQTIRV